jgi:hypothetical protein
MTLDQATAYLHTYQKWRRGTDERTMDEAGLHPSEIGQALDTLLFAIPVLQRDLSSTRAQLKKCQVQREKFHSQLRQQATTQQ